MEKFYLADFLGHPSLFCRANDRTSGNRTEIGTHVDDCRVRNAPIAVDGSAQEREEELNVTLTAWGMQKSFN